MDLQGVCMSQLVTSPVLRRHPSKECNLFFYNIAINYINVRIILFFSRYKNVNCICNYGVPSKLQKSPYDKVDSAEYNKYLNILKSRSNLTEIGFKRIFNRISRKVDEIYDVNQHNLVFNGKWFIFFLVEDIKTLAGNQSYIRSSLHDRLITSLQLTLNASHSWSSKYSSVFKKLISNP